MKEKKEKELPFKVPEFDEEEFKKTESTKAFATLVVAAIAILMAVVSTFIWKSLQVDYMSHAWPISFCVGMVGLVLIPLFFKLLRIDFTKIGKSTWFFSAFSYFFLLLAFFVIFLNPPFSDATAPHVELTTLPNVQEPGGNVKIVVKVEDNVGIDPKSFLGEVIKKTDREQSNHPISIDSIPIQDKSIKDNVIEFAYDFNPGHNANSGIKEDYLLKVKIRDVNGHFTETVVNFSYSSEAINLLKPVPSNSNLTKSETVMVELSENIPVIKNEITGEIISPIVYLEANDKTTRLIPKESGLYVSSTQVWPQGDVKVKVFAEVFSDEDGKYKNKIVDSTTYSFKVE